MIRPPRLFVCCVLLAVACLRGLSQDVASHTPAELSARDGLANFFAKLEKGGPVTVAYLGGSITAQNGWRVLSRDWLQKQYPKATVTGVHAAIGGTGSDLGVFRVEADALQAKPDLLFVEFAVNDSGTPPERIRKAMEGIVRKTWRALPETDICFVYTVTAKDTPALAAGGLKQSERVMEEVAAHYGIPTVHLGLEVARLEKEGKLVMKSDDAPMTRVSGDELNEAAALAKDAQGRIIFSKDGVHPYPETGHVLYMQALARSFEKMRDTGRTGPHALPEPLSADNWEAARQFSLDRGGVFSGTVTRLDPKVDEAARAFANRMPALWRFGPGAALRFKFKGTKVAIYDLLGPDGATVEITVDGKSRRVIRFDGYCTYRRLSTLGIGDNLPDAVHEVAITVLAENPDKRALLFERNREDFDKSPAKYEPTVWHAGAIFIVGEMVE